jgi:glycosyltransferase involved in cell wall biosynthesis
MMCEVDGLGGAEMIIVRLARALGERGYTVAGVGPEEGSRPQAGSMGWLSKTFVEAGFEWRTYETRHGFDRKLAGRLRSILSELGATIVHSHEFGMAVYGAAAAGRLGLPHVITMHGNMRMTNRWARRVALRWAISRSDATVAVSHHTRQHLETALGLSSGLLTVIPNGVPERPGDRAAGRRAASAQDSELLILAVGSLMPRKGYHYLLDALAELEGKGLRQPWRLAIAGAGAERENLIAQAESLGLTERVMRLGGRDDVPDLLAASDIYTMPSIWEGLPLALLEAMSAGKPIVASDVGGIPEALRHDEDGLLVPPEDTSALAEALGRLLTDGAQRERLATGALARARREFTIDAMTDGYESVYRAL